MWFHFSESRWNVVIDGFGSQNKILYSNQGYCGPKQHQGIIPPRRLRPPCMHAQKLQGWRLVWHESESWQRIREEDGRPVRTSPTCLPVSPGRQSLITSCVLMREEAFCPIPSEQSSRLWDHKAQSPKGSLTVRCHTTHLAVICPLLFWQCETKTTGSWHL